MVIVPVLGSRDSPAGDGLDARLPAGSTATEATSRSDLSFAVNAASRTSVTGRKRSAADGPRASPPGRSKVSLGRGIHSGPDLSAAEKHAGDCVAPLAAFTEPLANS